MQPIWPASKNLKRLQNQNPDKSENMPAGTHFQIMEELPTDFKTIMHNYHVTAANVRAGLDPNHGIDEEPEYVEVYYQGDSAKLLHYRPCAPRKGEILVQSSYLTGARRLVVQRDDDTLISEGLKLHAKEVAASMLSELNLGSLEMLQPSQSCDGKEHYRL